ncbi:hypothetical protein EHQ12_17855 [Leptospira gomenensis]|uniref:Uncharacterized protein n=1 Tax=Leptospira gomenensis TaxID=2484974 RepID=A0A5F1YTH0_9LEPT|nr:hypothetical protein [Leptospira gomenensis]TGK33203.1 hypothetical protein EHQ12_17855 [Leptospira gomenensis]TGK35564.1 hypothetical protein EHQ17_06470 [Leptospira gomenensis]TGK40888.1 hypothetical protein EHQ07_17430 [Leptospira gomenensis]TGK61178.1 hypothetical protein EHQ13_09965 [Leptospira gomenensis]
MILRFCISLIVLAVCIGCSGSWSREEEEDRFLRTDSAVAVYPDLTVLKDSLQILLKTEGKKGQTFYVSQIMDSHFYLYWENERAILILNPIRPPYQKDYVTSIRFPTGSSRIELNNETVFFENDIEGSSYLTNRHFVRKILGYCRRGIRIVL